jgi:hypothetical protein
MDDMRRIALSSAYRRTRGCGYGSNATSLVSAGRIVQGTACSFRAIRHGTSRAASDISCRVVEGAELTVKEESAGGIRFGRHEPFARVPPELAQHGPEGGFTPPRGVAGHPNARGGCTNSTATTSEICRRCDISQVTRPRLGKRGVIIKKPGGEQGSGDCNRPHQGRTASDGVPGDLRIEAQAVGALMQRDGWMQFVLSIVRREAAAA